MINLRKALVIGVSVITVFSMSMIAVPFQVEAATPGDLIKIDGYAPVYYLGNDNKRYVFPNESTYFSWYNDFSTVLTLGQTEVESYPLAANVVIRPGTKLIKRPVPTDPKVYAVEPNGKLRHVPSEAVAVSLYGNDWAKRVVDIVDSFFVNYIVTNNPVQESVYPAGSLVKYGTAADVFYINGAGEAQKIASEAAFLANRFDWNDILTAPATATKPATGADITAKTTLADTSQGGQSGTGPVVDPNVGSGLSAALSSDTPSAGNIPAGSPVDFLRFNLTAANDGDVAVNSITVTGFELGDSENIDDIAFYYDGTKLGTSKNMNSDRVAVFNFAPAISIPAGQTKALLVRATIAAAATGNYAIGIAKAADIVTNGGSVSGSFPIVGNAKAVATGTNIGTMSLTAPTIDNAATADFGEDNVLLAEFSLTGANEEIFFESMRLRNGGTNSNDIVSNLKLFVDGTEVADGTYADRYATFSMENVVINKGDTVTVQVYGDMGIGNVGNTFNLYVRDASDLAFIGKTYGFGIAPTIVNTFDGAGEGIVVTLSAGSVTIDMDKAATPSKDVRPGTDNVVLATFGVVSNAEDAVINYIKTAGADEFRISGTGLDLNEVENVELRDVSTGVVFDVTAVAGVAPNTIALTLDEEIYLTKGVKKTFEVRADLKGANDATPIDANDTLVVTLEDGAFSITGVSSDAELNGQITPTSVLGSVTTVKTASLIWTTTELTNKTLVPGATDEVIYRATAKAGTASDVTLTSVKLDADNVNFDSFEDSNISALDLYVDGVKVKTVSNQITGDGLATAAVNFTSLNAKIVAGATAVIEVKASFAGTFSNEGDFELEIADAASSIVVKDVDNDTFDETVANVGTDSRLVTLASTGALKVELKTDDLKANDDTYVVAGSATAADRYLGELVFTTENEDVKVKTLVLGQNGTAADDDILAVQLFNESGVKVAEEGVDANGVVNFDTLNLVVTADQATSLYIGVVTKSINADGDSQGTADHDTTIQFNLASAAELAALGLAANTAVTAMGNTSGQDIAIVMDAGAGLVVGEYSAATVFSKTATISGSVLTLITNEMSDASNLAVGLNKTIAKYKFVFDNGANRTAANEALKAQLVELNLAISATAGVAVTNVQAYVDGAASSQTTAVDPVGGVATIDLTTGLLDSGLVDGVVTLVIVADIAGVDANDSVSTAINSLTAGDFVYDGNNGTDASDTTNPLLNIVDVTGATISN